jgi:hypothetical protein
MKSSNFRMLGKFSCFIVDIRRVPLSHPKKDEKLRKLFLTLFLSLFLDEKAELWLSDTL